MDSDLLRRRPRSNNVPHAHTLYVTKKIFITCDYTLSCIKIFQSTSLNYLTIIICSIALYHVAPAPTMRLTSFGRTSRPCPVDDQIQHQPPWEVPIPTGLRCVSHHCECTQVWFILFSFNKNVTLNLRFLIYPTLRANV